MDDKPLAKVSKPKALVSFSSPSISHRMIEVSDIQVAGKGIKQEIKTGVSHRMMEVNKMQVAGKGIKQEIKTGV